MAATLAYHRSTDAVLSPQGVSVSVSTAQCTGMDGTKCHNANGSTSTALVNKDKQDTNNSALVVASSSPSSPASCAMTVLTAVERSVLRALAFVFYQLDREQAKYCASSILRWYFQLQAQLPVSAVESLERVAASVISLSDAKFTSFWLSLLEKEIEIDHADDELMGCCSTLESRITIQSYEGEQDEVLQQVKREKTLIRRLYQHIHCSIQGLFFANRSGKAGNGSNERGRTTQTPCTSPIDLSDDSHYQNARHRRKHNRYARYDDDESNDEHASRQRDECSNKSNKSNSYDHDQYSDDDSDDGDNRGSSDDLFEPGWAVEYMEQQESTVSTELTRRMRKMMHSSIPLNLFRATVAYSSEASEEVGEGGFVGVISPESFPPTPITRDLQTRRMNCYTVSVLDHATLALRLLEANCNSSSSPQQPR